MNRAASSAWDDHLYRKLLRHALLRLFFLYFTPLLLLALFFHVQYRVFLDDVEERHRQSLAEHQAGMLDAFLGDRLLNLTGQASLLLDPVPTRLQAGLDELRRTSEAFVDLAVFNGEGRMLGYAGPLPELSRRNYRQEKWFSRLLAGESSHVITDVYEGFRASPHFTMAVKMVPDGEVRILRAVLSPEAALAQLEEWPGHSTREPGLSRWMVGSIWLVAGGFFLVGSLLIWGQARWVARNQFQALQTELELSRQLAQAAKLATVGELASGIAHEINNPLAVIAEKAGLVRDKLDPELGGCLTPEELNEELGAIEAAVFRCTHITRQLLGFVRQAEVQWLPCDPARLMDGLVDRLLGPELAVADITVQRRYSVGAWELLTDPGQLEQVFLNILKNAMDAMEGPGTITITMAAAEVAGRVRLEIADTGCGMTPQQLEQVFMPFFTSKEPGKGTGLGLSVSYGIVAGLGGTLSARSEPGRGSTFIIELPVGQGGSPTPPKAGTPPRTQEVDHERSGA